MKFRWFPMVLGLTVLLFTCDPSLAGKPARQVSVAPASVTSPVTSAGAMNICVSGFYEGDQLMMSIPWTGSPSSHSNLSYASTVDASGGFCFSCPPDWTQMDLQPGTYTIDTRWSKSGAGGGHRGPAVTFVVMAN